MIRTIQNSFVSGEISPTLYGRHDLKAYFSGAERLDNWIVRKAGGLQKRQGTDIAIDLTAHPSCRIIPFYYDRTRGVLILLTAGACRFMTRGSDGQLAVVQGTSGDYVVTTPWPAPTLPLIKSYQLGDTVYLSAPGFQAVKMVRTSDDNWTLSTLTGIVSVATPAAPTATPSADFSGAAATANYALYAIKNGVYSLPAKVSAAITAPWTAGSTVTIAFTPDLNSGIDGYVLAKMAGAYYGILQEFYPERTATPLAGKTYTTSGVDTSLAATRNLATWHEPALSFDDPAQQTAAALLLPIQDYCIHIARDGSAAPYAEYESATPFTFTYIIICAGAVHPSRTMRGTKTVNYYSREGECQPTVQSWNGASWDTVAVNWAAWSGNPTTLGGSYLISSYPATEHTKIRVTFALTDPLDTGFLCRGIGLTHDGLTYVTSGAWTQPVDSRADFRCLAQEGTQLATHCLAADLEITSPNDMTARDAYISRGLTAPSLLLNIHAYAHHLPRLESEITVEFTPASATALSSVRLWLGAACANTSTQDSVRADYTNYPPGVTLTGYNGATPTTLYSGVPDIPALGASPYFATIPVSSVATYDRFTITFDTVNPADTGLLCRGIALFNRAGTPAYITGGTWVAGSTATTFYCRGLNGSTTSNANHTIATIGVSDASDATARESYTPAYCSPTRTFIQDNSPVALAVSEAGGIYTAFVRFVSPASSFAVSEIRVWLGAQVGVLPLYTPGGVLSTLTSNATSAKIAYTADGGTNWTLLPTAYTLPNAYLTEPISIIIPEIAPETLATINGWSLVITAAANAPVILRGCKFLNTTISSTFVDQNHSPSTIVGRQTYIHPGSSDMDADLICHHQQRLVLAASSNDPFSLWFSKTADIGMFYAGSPLVDTDPFAVTIPATRASKILNMVSDRRLILFTEGGVYVCEGSETEGFSYRTCRLTKVANTGACSVEPFAAQNTLLFVQDDSRTVTELKYDLSQDGLIPVERSVLAAHLTESSPIIRLAWQSAPNGVLWVLLADGTLLSFTYMPEHEVYAWASHTLPAGVLITDLIAPGSIESSTDTETATRVYALATCGTKTFLLKLRPPISSSAPSAASAACLDLAQPVTVAAGATTLVPVYAYPDSTVTALNLSTGVATLHTSTSNTLTPVPAAGNYLLGYPVTATLRTLRPELPDRNIQAIRKAINDTTLRVHRTRSLSVSPSDATVYPVTSIQTPPAAIAAGVVPLLSKDLLVKPIGAWNPDGRLTVTSSDPWPAEILSVITTLEI